MTWVASSSILLVAGCLIPRGAHLIWALPRARSIDFATVLAGVTVIVLLTDPDPADAVVKATSGVTILVVLLRQLMMSHTNATLARNLERSEKHFRTMVDGTRDVFIMVDDEGRLSDASPASPTSSDPVQTNWWACERPRCCNRAIKPGSPPCSSR